ncbi:hypothetical protein [Actinoplanes sp. HUAS TT8]|uniref:hypothetical protein n=1 Tax=Actinoplanes sp. HUAS TT8 TaxID=3447453 RepID=UPI003F521ADC
MGTGDLSSPPRPRWLFALAGLPLPVLVFALGFWVHGRSWSGVTLPLLLLPSAVFVRYAAQPAAGRVPVLRILGAYGSGVLLCLGALAVDVVPAGWVELVLDVLLLILGAAFLGDGFRWSATGRRPVPVEQR